LARKLRALAREYAGTAGVYVQSLTGGAGAAWNAKAQFPAASTLKLAIAATVLAEHSGIPPPGSRVHGLLRSMITRSDNASANALEVWLAGSTSAGSRRVNSLMRSIGLVDSEMYGGYELRTLASRIPIRVEQQPAFGFGKHTSAFDMAALLRAVWLASGSLGRLRDAQPGFTAADGRYLLWLLAHVSDAPKLDRVRKGNPGVVVLHKAGWVNTARHDAGLVFWRGGVFVAGVMTWSSRGAGTTSDRLAGKVAALTLERLRRTEG
jgi:drug/metabolite transporter superfamily protein YnfA